MLLDEGCYYCSIRTMYRILESRNEVRERRAQAAHPPRVRPELVADGPDQVWTWDITKLKSQWRGLYFDLYVMLDIFSRKVIRWEVHVTENGDLAKAFIENAIAANGGVGFLPQNNLEEPPVVETTDDPERPVPELVDLLPPSPNQAYDMHKVIGAVVDDGEFLEYHALWARNLVCGFGRIGAHAVGIVGNQPMILAGVLDIESSEKGARFVRTCDAFNIPLVTFVDVPGFMPGTDQEYGGIIRHGAKLLYAYCEATVPRIQVITRKAYGGAYVVMNSKSIGCDLAYAWPSAELAVMGPSGAVEIVYRREIATSAEPEARKAELIEEYTEAYANPYVAAERGYVDDVIDPTETRAVLARSLELLRTKREELPKRKHGNVPL